MKALLLYLVQVIIISGLLYGYYHIFLRNKKFHHHNRYYLLSATLLSLFIPFLNIPVYFSQSPDHSSFVIQALTSFSPSASQEPLLLTEVSPLPLSQGFDWLIIPELLFSFIAFLFFLRFLLSLLKIRKIIRSNPHEKLETIEFVNTIEPGTPYSFFRWLFWHKDIALSSEKGKQIFRHELFHINQKHSIDIVFMEILFILFFLNPFFWLVKKELRAIHEFLADRYAVSENNRWEYAELLLMQTLNTQQSLVNPFFHNQIKRRIAMITTSQKTRHQYLRKLMVLPLAALAITIFAFKYQYKEQQTKITNIERPFTVVIDAGHGGEDNGAIASDGTREKNITLAIAKRIQALNEDNNLTILLTREDDRFPALKSRTEFTNQQKADLFLSIHVNSASGENKACFEIYSPSKTKVHYSENKILATILMGKLAQLNKAELSRSVKNSIWVLENSDCPSALIECGNMHYEKDLRFISDAKNQDEIAKSILSAVDHYVSQLNSSDWKERKNSVIDTVKPNIILTQYGKDKKYGGTYNGKKIKEIYDHESGALVFILENHDMIMLSKEVSAEIRKKYGYDIAISEMKKGEVKVNQSNIIFDRVEVEPAFPGGPEKWRQYLQRNLNQAIPVEKKAPDGIYTVVVQFIVDKAGNITEVKPLTNHGYGMEEESIRIIRKGPKWEPAIQNGLVVKAFKKQAITFQVPEEKVKVSIQSATKEELVVYNGTKITQVAQEGRSVRHTLDPRTLYIGINNILTVESGDLDPKLISATISNGTITKQENSFLVWIKPVIEDVSVRFYMDINGTNEFIKEAIFKSRTLPEFKNGKPPVNTGPATPAKPQISVSELQNISIHNLLQLPNDTEIIGYTFTIDTDDAIVRVPNNGSQFNQATIDLIKETQGGRLITIDLIRIKKDGVEKKIPSQLFYITD